MKKINWLSNIGAVCAFNILGWIMLHFDARVSKCDGALILDLLAYSLCCMQL